MAKSLVVDDDPIFRTFVEAILERDGHEVLTVANARHVVRGVREHLMRTSFDIAIVDILMPEISGIEVIRTIRGICRGAKIVAITGGGLDAGVESRLKLAESCGAEATLAKPFTAAVLCRTVEETLGCKRSRQNKSRARRVQKQPAGAALDRPAYVCSDASSEIPCRKD
jgi:CheY-like chemotaxis protein